VILIYAFVLSPFLVSVHLMSGRAGVQPGYLALVSSHGEGMVDRGTGDKWEWSLTSYPQKTITLLWLWTGPKGSHFHAFPAQQPRKSTTGSEVFNSWCFLYNLCVYGCYEQLSSKWLNDSSEQLSLKSKSHKNNYTLKDPCLAPEPDLCHSEQYGDRLDLSRYPQTSFLGP